MGLSFQNSLHMQICIKYNKMIFLAIKLTTVYQLKGEKTQNCVIRAETRGWIWNVGLEQQGGPPALTVILYK